MAREPLGERADHPVRNDLDIASGKLEYLIIKKIEVGLTHFFKKLEAKVEGVDNYIVNIVLEQYTKKTEVIR